MCLPRSQRDHCCVCTASVEHAEHETTGCEFCDQTVNVLFDGKTVLLTSTRHNDEPELRFTFTAEEANA